MPEIKSKVLDIREQTSSPDVERTSFTSCMICSDQLDGSFTDPFRVYESVDDVSSDLIALSTVAAKVTAMFINSGSKVIVGKLLANVKQVTTLTLSGAEDGDYVVSISGTDYSFTAASSSETLICAALQTASNANPLVVATAVGPVLTLTATTAGVPFSVTSSAPSPSTWTEVLVTADVSLTSNLNAIKLANNSFNHFVVDTRTDSVNQEAALWAEANEKFFYYQTSSVGVKDAAVTSDIMSTVKGLNYAFTHSIYRGDDAIFHAESFMARYSSINPDTHAGQGFLLQLKGVPEETLTTTEVNAILGKNGNFMGSLKKVVVHFNGVQANGDDIEYKTATQWLTVRTCEDFAQFLLDTTEKNSRFGMNDANFEIAVGIAMQRALRGQAIGHIDPDVAPVAKYTARYDMDPADVAARTFRFTIGAQFNVGVKKVVGLIYVPITFTGL